MELCFGIWVRVMPWETSLLCSQSYFGGPHFILCVALLGDPLQAIFHLLRRSDHLGLERDTHLGVFDHWIWCVLGKTMPIHLALWIFYFYFFLGGGNHRWTRVENLQVGSLTILAYKDYAYRDWRSSGNLQKCIPPPLSYIIIKCSILYRSILF